MSNTEESERNDERCLSDEVRSFLRSLATDINNLGEDVQRDVLKHSDFIKGALLGKSVARTRDWQRKLEEVLLQMRDVYDTTMDLYSLIGSSGDSQGLRKLREWEKTFLEAKFSYLAAPHRRMDHLRLAPTAENVVATTRTAALDRRVRSGLKRLGVGSWLRELRELAEMYNSTHLSSLILKHLDDPRVRFLQADEAREDSSEQPEGKVDP